MSDFVRLPWILDEEEPGMVLADAGDDGAPECFQVSVCITSPGQSASDQASAIAARLVELHNAALSR